MIELPFKDRSKQLRYMRKHSKERRKLVRDYKVKQNLKQSLTEKMIRFAREFLQERRNYPIESIPNFKGGILLEQAFTIDSENALETATRAICNAEDELIRRSKNIQKIGIIEDLQISLLNDKHGIIWEKLTTLTEYDTRNLLSLI